MTYLRPLSLRQALACEYATHPRCRCRCRGVLHGARRNVILPPEEFLESLPWDDPHAVRPTGLNLFDIVQILEEKEEKKEVAQ